MRDILDRDVETIQADIEMAKDMANNTLALYPNRYVVFAASQPYHNFSNAFQL